MSPTEKTQIGQTGGFVCCTKTIRDVLFNLARTFVYSTALSVPTVVGARVAVELGVGEEGRRRREWLWRVVRGCGGGSPIVLVRVQDEERLAEVMGMLEQMGVKVGGIRPPTVVGCRVRMSLGYVGGMRVQELVGMVEKVRGVCLGVGLEGRSRL